MIIDDDVAKQIASTLLGLMKHCAKANRKHKPDNAEDYEEIDHAIFAERKGCLAWVIWIIANRQSGFFGKLIFDFAMKLIVI